MMKSRNKVKEKSKREGENIHTQKSSMSTWVNFPNLQHKLGDQDYFKERKKKLQTIIPNQPNSQSTHYKMMK